MDRVELGLKKAYRGWGIPGHLYSRQGEILAVGQEDQFALSGGMLEEMFSPHEPDPQVELMKRLIAEAARISMQTVWPEVEEDHT